MAAMETGGDESSPVELVVAHRYAWSWRRHMLANQSKPTPGKAADSAGESESAAETQPKTPPAASKRTWKAAALVANPSPRPSPEPKRSRSEEPTSAAEGSERGSPEQPVVQAAQLGLPSANRREPKSTPEAADPIEAAQDLPAHFGAETSSTLTPSTKTAERLCRF